MISPQQRSSVPASNVDSVISATLGTSLLLARENSGRLFLLNPSAALSWRALRDARRGNESAAVAAALREAYALPQDLACAEAESLLSGWQEADLLGAGAVEEGEPEFDDWVIEPPPLKPLGSDLLSVMIAGLPMALDIPGGELWDIISRALAGIPAADGGAYTHLLRFEGVEDRWSLLLNGAVHARGGGADEAVSQMLGLLSDLATQARDRLIVVHGAGLAHGDGRTLLLIAPSGRGKTTLAAALSSEGMTLLNDDVVPVGRDGAPISLGMPLCLKSGSWDVLRDFRPDLDAARIVERHGHQVRFLTPKPQAATAPLRIGLLIFPTYLPGLDARTEWLTPEQALQFLIEAQSIIRPVTREKLQDLARWVASIPAVSLSYPDIGTAMAIVRRFLDSV